MMRRMAGNVRDISSAVKLVVQGIQEAVQRRPSNLPNIQPTLVAVSKTKPAEHIIEAYDCGIRHFGENYLNELQEKAQCPQASFGMQKILEHCKDIKWHFIGHLQTKKVSKVIGIPNIHMVETIHSEKCARLLDNGWGKNSYSEKLKVMVQVNTSGEENKFGCPPSEAKSLVKYIMENCTNLDLKGLMTIGAYGYDLSKGPNPDFLRLVECKEEIIDTLGLGSEELELSMGMSTDYQHAIELGSSNVRVGSTIFGAREYKDKTSTNSQQSTGAPSASGDGQSSNSQQPTETPSASGDEQSLNSQQSTTEKPSNSSESQFTNSQKPENETPSDKQSRNVENITDDIIHKVKNIDVS